jgi:hypothetical protein
MSLIFGAKKSATSEIKIGAKNEEKNWGQIPRGQQKSAASLT